MRNIFKIITILLLTSPAVFGAQSDIEIQDVQHFTRNVGPLSFSHGSISISTSDSLHVSSSSIHSDGDLTIASSGIIILNGKISARGSLNIRGESFFNQGNIVTEAVEISPHS